MVTASAAGAASTPGSAQPGPAHPGVAESPEGGEAAVDVEEGTEADDAAKPPPKRKAGRCAIPDALASLNDRQATQLHQYRRQTMMNCSVYYPCDFCHVCDT